jgi:predicted phosphodiesterase
VNSPVPHPRMRLALLSDVHANLAGLRAVAEALAGEAPIDEVIVAGDHLWGGPRPRQTWELLLHLGWTLVRGNEDERLAAARPDLGPPETWSGYRQALNAFHAFTRAAVGPAVLAQLAALPFQRRLATPAGDLLVVHATPRDVDAHTADPDTPLAAVETAYGGTGAAAIAFGHYHRAFVRPTPFALLVDVASVGLPRDGRPLATYTLLTATPDGSSAEQRYAPYDPDEERAAARSAGMPVWRPNP